MSKATAPNLRSGFTTGACAAAAAKAALLALLRQQMETHVTIRLPAGTAVSFLLHRCGFSASDGHASVIKDAGDDPDVTHGAEVQVRVAFSSIPGIAFQRGEGVGLVTKKGLPVPPGEPAINPAPRRLIADTLQVVLAEHGRDAQGLIVEIAVPGGEELAKKTFNPRLGIVGGISILGTSGIVVPYSTAAWLASVVQEIDVALAQGFRHLALTVGERGERFARKLLPLPEEAFVQIGPFFGDALQHGARAGAARLSLVAMAGKLAKFAAGNASVHSTAAAQDFAFLAEVARDAGADAAHLSQVLQANTAQEVASLMQAAGHERFFALICERAAAFAVTLVGTAVPVDVYLTGQDGTLLGERKSGA